MQFLRCTGHRLYALFHLLALRGLRRCTGCGTVPPPSPSLAAGTGLKVVQDQHGHSTVVLTADTYVSVAAELALSAAEAVARLVMRAGRRPPGGGRIRKRSAPPRAVVTAA